MSTILKALRRLEEEKAAAQEARPLREQIATQPRELREAGRRRSWPAATAALALGVAAGSGLIWWVFADVASQAPVEVAEAPAPAEATPAPAPPAAELVPPTVPAAAAEAVATEPAGIDVATLDGDLPGDAFSSEVEIVDRPPAEPRIQEGGSAAPVDRPLKPGSRRPVESSSAAARHRLAAMRARLAAERAGQPVPPASPLPEELAAAAPTAPVTPEPIAPPPAPDPAPAVEVAAAPPAPTAPPVAAEELPARAEEPLARTAESPPPAPQPAAQPAPARPKVAAARPAPPPTEVEEPAPPPARFPVLEVERTEWHPLSDRRIAWLRAPGGESRRVVEGDVVEGMVVAKIEPSGVVFERDGEQIHRGVGKR